MVAGRREDERTLRAWEQLRFRVYSAARDIALGTQLFRTNFQLHEPEITVNVYARFVDLNVSLNGAQFHLIPLEGRSRDLDLFAQELEGGIRRVAATLELDFTTDPAQFGGSGPIRLVTVPIGYRAVLLRTDRG